VPNRLGYRFVGQQRDEGTGSEDTCVECIWRIERSGWHQSEPVVCW